MRIKIFLKAAASTTTKARKIRQLHSSITYHYHFIKTGVPSGSQAFQVQDFQVPKDLRQQEVGLYKVG